MNRKGQHIGDSRLALVAERRAQAVLLRNAGLPYKKIAAILGYSDHTTVLHFIKTHEGEIASNPTYCRIYTAMLEKICVENLH